ncbi:MAG: hypothetical protein PHW52_04095 [Candidatus Pacebacteria bacterium]|nr:hypothetical protein [Candidatus Paceibacterota bacterium]
MNTKLLKNKLVWVIGVAILLSIIISENRGKFVPEDSQSLIPRSSISEKPVLTETEIINARQNYSIELIDWGRFTITDLEFDPWSNQVQVITKITNNNKNVSLDYLTLLGESYSKSPKDGYVGGSRTHVKVGDIKPGEFKFVVIAFAVPSVKISSFYVILEKNPDKEFLAELGHSLSKGIEFQKDCMVISGKVYNRNNDYYLGEAKAKCPSVMFANTETYLTLEESTGRLLRVPSTIGIIK